MPVLGEPIPVQEDDPGGAFYHNEWLRSLFVTAQNLSLTSREGAPQHGDKAGNFNGVYVIFTSNGVANTEDAVAHTLGRVPVGRLLVDQNKAASLYRSGTDYTATNVYWKSSAATVAWVTIVF